MKLWLLEREEAYYGQAQALVVRAESEDKAIDLAKSQAQYDENQEPQLPWKCCEITVDGDPGIILVDYFEP